MDVSIANYINRNTRTIAQIVDQTFKRLLESTTALDSVMPTTNYMDRMLLLIKYKAHRPTIAQVVAEEQEIPPTRPRATLDEQTLGNLKLGKKLVWKARDYELMDRLMNLAAQSGPRGSQMEMEIKRIFFGQIADLVPAITEALTVRAIEIATTGSSIFTDPLTGARVNIAYTVDPSLVLTAQPAAARRWTTPATCTPLADLESHSLAYYNLLVEWPQKIFLHFNTLRDVANSVEAKTAYLRTMGADAAAPDTGGVYLKDEQVIDLIKTRCRCQSVELFDAQYSEETEGGDPVDRFFLPENTYFFAKDGYMERAFVPTVEKDFAPGIFQHTKVVEEAPRQERSVAVANCIPFVADERYIAARRVA
jgi:hypothetical protein